MATTCYSNATDYKIAMEQISENNVKECVVSTESSDEVNGPNA